jgi:hypothetical protein
MSFTPSSSVSNFRIPILLIGFCRPIEFKRIIDQVELLSPRDIHVSLDGPTEGKQLLTDEVLVIAERWRQESKHNISIAQSEINLGLLSHFILALKSFFARYNFGLVLEDDMEFRSEFIEFLDSEHGVEALTNYWSVSGHNPSKNSDLNMFNDKNEVFFFETSIHTIWGWAASRSSIDFFVDFVNRGTGNPLILHEGIQSFVTDITKDRIFGGAIVDNWSGKIVRAINSQKPNWDNYWVLAAWAARKKSVMPNYSLSRENPEIFGHQTHPRSSRGKSWTQIPRVTIHRGVFEHSSHRDRKLVSIWGNTRMRAYKNLLRSTYSLVLDRKFRWLKR